jgi:hypothetical protein
VTDWLNLVCFIGNATALGLSFINLDYFRE